MTLATLTGQVMMMFSSDPASGITSPLDVDSLFYWYAADVGVTTNNNKVTQWNDLSGNGHHVTQADTSKAPTYSATGGPNSRPTMTFDGTNDFLASAAHFWGSDDITVIVVYKHTNATSNTTEQIIGRWGAADSLQFLIHARNAALSYQLRSNWDDDLITALGSTSYAYSYSAKSASFRLISNTHNGTKIGNTVHIDGSSVTVTDVPSTNDDGSIGNLSQPLDIGARALPSGAADLFLQGSISEIIVFSRALTTGERSGLEQNYLCKKYGLACP
jgi:hypothetical protein